MWWDVPITVTKGTSRDDPVEVEASLIPGVIRRVRIQFPPGCTGFVKATLWRHEHQFLPEAAEGYITGDDYTYDEPVDYEIKETPAVVRVVCWNTASKYDHTVTVGIYVRPTGMAGLGDLLRELFLGGGMD